jgi:hypothetical protein
MKTWGIAIFATLVPVGMAFLGYVAKLLYQAGQSMGRISERLDDHDDRLEQLEGLAYNKGNHRAP